MFYVAVVSTIVIAVLLIATISWEPVRVQGESMLPALRPGDLLATRPVREGEPAPGQVVVVRRPGLEVVKRVKEAPGDLGPDALWVEGDNAARSTDSRTAGPVHRADVVGVVVFRYWPPHRIRRVR